MSCWEAIIKHSVGKLPLPEPAEMYIPAQRLRHRIESLPIDEVSVRHLAALLPVHRDPFDRILVAQALQHGLSLVTVDEAVRAYPVSLLPDR